MDNNLFTTYLNSILFMVGAQLDLAKERKYDRIFIQFYLSDILTDRERHEILDKVESLLNSSIKITFTKIGWREEECYEVIFIEKVDY